jgi:hypothetical protein
MATASNALSDANTNNNTAQNGRASPLPAKPKLLGPLLDDKLDSTIPSTSDISALGKAKAATLLT